MATTTPQAPATAVFPRRLHRRSASQLERLHFARCADWCRDRSQWLAGLPFDDPLVSVDGCHITLFVPCSYRGPDADAKIRQALRQAYRAWDVVSHEVVVCPSSWFTDAACPWPSLPPGVSAC